MAVGLTAVFVLAYLAIALEEPLKVNKSAAALIAAGLLWTIYALAGGNPADADRQLNESLIDTAQIAFFLMGAMTIVEIVEAAPGGTVEAPKKRFNAGQFAREVRAEARKITWTSRKETWITSVMVAIMVLLAAAFFWTVNTLISLGITQILKLASGG